MIRLKNFYRKFPVLVIGLVLGICIGTAGVVWAIARPTDETIEDQYDEVKTIDDSLDAVEAALTAGSTIETSLYGNMMNGSTTMGTALNALINATNNVANYNTDQANECWLAPGSGINGLRCEGATADGYEVTIQSVDPDQDNTITFPDLETQHPNVGGKVDIGHHIVSDTTEVDGSTLVYTMEDSGSAIEVICGGTASGTTDAYYIYLYGGSTVVLTLTSDDGDNGDWHSHMIVATDDGAAVSATGHVTMGTQDAAVASRMTAGDFATTLDTSAVTTWKIAIDLEGTTDDFSLEYCIWNVLY